METNGVELGMSNKKKQGRQFKKVRLNILKSLNRRGSSKQQPLKKLKVSVENKEEWIAREDDELELLAIERIVEKQRCVDLQDC